MTLEGLRQRYPRWGLLMSIIKKMTTVIVLALTVIFFAIMAKLIIMNDEKYSMALGIGLSVFFGLPLLSLALYLIFGPVERPDEKIAKRLQADLEAKSLEKRTDEDAATLFLLNRGFVPHRDKSERCSWHHRNEMSIDGEPLAAQAIYEERIKRAAEAGRKIREAELEYQAKRAAKRQTKLTDAVMRGLEHHLGPEYQLKDGVLFTERGRRASFPGLSAPLFADVAKAESWLEANGQRGAVWAEDCN